MRKLIIVAALLVAVPLWAAEPQTDDQKTFYALGVDVAKQLSGFTPSAEEREFVMQGMSDALAGKTLIAHPKDYESKIDALYGTRMQALVQKQKDQAKPFLENAAKEKGVEKTASGLLYKEIKAGAGAQPKASDTVTVHYTGAFIDGEVFTTTLVKGEPSEFMLEKVIPCWTEGITKMKVGGKAKLICHSDLAYGDEGKMPYIPGGTALVYEVELLDVRRGDPVPAFEKSPAPKPECKTKKKKK